MDRSNAINEGKYEVHFIHTIETCGEKKIHYLKSCSRGRLTHSIDILFFPPSLLPSFLPSLSILCSYKQTNQRTNFAYIQIYQYMIQQNLRFCFNSTINRKVGNGNCIFHRNLDMVNVVRVGSFLVMQFWFSHWNYWKLKPNSKKANKCILKNEVSNRKKFQHFVKKEISLSSIGFDLFRLRKLSSTFLKHTTSALIDAGISFRILECQLYLLQK